MSSKIVNLMLMAHRKTMKWKIACSIWSIALQKASATILQILKSTRHAQLKTHRLQLRKLYSQGATPSTYTLLREGGKMVSTYGTILTFATIAFVMLSTGVADQEDDESVKFWVRNYIEWHDVNRVNASRIAVFLPIKAGLADNVKGMLNMWVYSVLTKRLLLLSSNEPVPITDVLSDRAIGRFIYRKQFDGNNLTWKGNHLKFSYNSGLTPTMRELLRGNHRIVALHMSKAQPIPNLIPRLRSIHFGSINIPPFTESARRAVTKILLEPHPALARTVDDFSRRVGAPYLAVHARLGAGTNEAKHHRFAFIRGRERDIAFCLARAVHRLARDDSQPVFVATDTPSFRLVFRRALREIMPRASVHHVDGNVAHYRWLKGGKAGRKAHFAMHAENLLIGGAEHIVALESGFPEIAYWRGRSRSYNKVSFKECGM